MKTIENKTFDEERALYGRQDLLVKNCVYAGPADGESAFKECRHIEADDCHFDLRYPFWHCQGLNLHRAELTTNCRAALWYSSQVAVSDSNLHGIKAFRECADVDIRRCDIHSQEFGWSVRNLHMEDCQAVGEYFLLRCENLQLHKVHFQGKYAFQYIQNALLEDCVLDTKDAFWHGKNVTVRNCTLKGEYLGWYSDGLTLIHCTIVGTQPLCYCKNLRLIECTMVDTDLAFEKSEVEATLCAPIKSIKNPLSGHITVPQAEEIILDDPQAKGQVTLTGCPEK